MKQIYFLSAALTLIGSISFAADSTSAAPAPAPITWSGFVDAYYSKNFNSPATETNQLRNFDIQENQFTLSLAELVIQKAASPVGFRFDLDFGPTNDLVQGGNGSTLNVLQQGYLTAVLPIGQGLTVDVGKFVTHMGNEVIESKDNWNYSRSFLFVYAIPYYHTGIRLAYPVSGNFTAALHIVNSWNTVIDNNNSKSVGLGLTCTPMPSTTIILNGMSGFEQTAGVPYGKKNVGEVIVTQQVGDDLSFALDADYGQERVNGYLNIWKGAAVYARYNLGARTDLAIRGEVFDDRDGYTTGTLFPKPTYKEITITLEYRPWDPIIVRLEGRDDFANGNSFISAGSIFPSRSSQPTLLLGVLTAF